MYRYGIVAIGYNRPESMKRLLSALEKADYLNQTVTLVVSIDNCGNDSVEDIAKMVAWSHGEKYIRTFPQRQGLRNHILKCGSYMEEYDLDAVAVFEDDVVPSPAFFSYMTQCTEQYSDDEDVAGISLYSHKINVNAKLSFQPQPSEYDVFWMQFAQSWGQVWLKKQWNSFAKWYETENDHIFDPRKIPAFVCKWPKTSWLKYHIKYCIEKGKYFVYPYTSYATCFSEAGEHTGATSSLLQLPMQTRIIESLRLPEHITEGIVYDAFFEYDDHSDICYDLYGTRVDYNGKNKVLSKKHLPYRVIGAFGLTLKPHEMNYLNDLPGDVVYLYDLSETVSAMADDGLSDLRTLNYYYNYFPGFKHAFNLLKLTLCRKWKTLKRGFQ